jgi:hypothetical protein
LIKRASLHALLGGREESRIRDSNGDCVDGQVIRFGDFESLKTIQTYNKAFELAMNKKISES